MEVGLQHNNMRGVVHLGVWSLALPAGSARRVLYNGDTPSQHLFFIHSDQCVSRLELMTEKLTMHE